MSSTWSFYSAGQLVFGSGAAAQLGRLVGERNLKSVLIVTDPALIAAGVFLAAGLLVPKVLKPLNRLWFLIGLGLHKVISPLVMGLLFYLTITPMALIMRLMGKDPLRRDFEPEAKSYWIERRPAGPAPESMRHQF